MFSWSNSIFAPLIVSIITGLVLLLVEYKTGIFVKFISGEINEETSSSSPVQQPDDSFTKFSGRLEISFDRILQIGDLSLILLFVGFMAMIVGHCLMSALSTWLFVVGASLIMTMLFLFVYGRVQGAKIARQAIQDSKDAMDVIQQLAIRLADMIAETQALMLKHSNEIDEILQLSIPTLAQIPVFQNIDLSRTYNVNKLIVDTTQSSRETVRDVHEALIHADVARLRKYSNELQKAQLVLRNALSLQNQIRESLPLPNYKQQLQATIDEMLQLTEYVIVIGTSLTTYLDRVESGLSTILPLVKMTPVANRFPLDEFQERTKNLREVAHQSINSSTRIRDAINSSNPKDLIVALQQFNKVTKLSKELLASDVPS